MNQNRTYYSREAAEQANRQKLLLALMALGVGAAVALMLAPNSGQEVRENLARTLEDGVSKGREALETTVKRLEKDLEILRKKVDEAV